MQPSVGRPTTSSTRRATPSGRSARPTGPAAKPAPAPALAPVVDYSKKPSSRSTVASALFLQRTMIPPSLVLGIGFIAFGLAYFLQPADSALHRIDKNYVIGVIACGAISVLSAVGLMWSVRKQMKRTT